MCEFVCVSVCECVSLNVQMYIIKCRYFTFAIWLCEHVYVLCVLVCGCASVYDLVRVSASLGDSGHL